jgi:hypothetical protein
MLGAGGAASLLLEAMEKLDVYGPAGIDAEACPSPFTIPPPEAKPSYRAVVIGKREGVDLPITIAQSHYLANIIRRRASGELPGRAMTELERYLQDNVDGVWENSWVRFPRDMLGPFAQGILSGDLLADKADPSQGYRTDLTDFIFRQEGREYLRIPISYLLKLSLAEAIDGQPPAGPRRDAA